MMMAGRGIAKVITGGQNTAAENAPFKWLVNGTVAGFPVVFLIAIAIVGVLALFVRRTAFGMVVESVGINPSASWMAGIRPNGILLTVYLVSGMLAAIGGVFSVGSVMVVDIAGTGYQSELDAILAVVVGGTSLAGGKFSIRGAVIGALLIATLDKTVLFLGISGAATPAFKAVVIVLLCLLQSQRVRTLFTQRRKADPAAPAELPKASVAA
jgi:simple sugar transport system permease protein